MDPARVAAARARALLPDEAGRLAELLGLLADPTRVRVVYALDAAEELRVGDVALYLGVSDDAVGYALPVLRTAGLVRAGRAGRAVYYRPAEEFPQPLREHCLPALVALSRRVEEA